MKQILLFKNVDFNETCKYEMEDKDKKVCIRFYGLWSSQRPRFSWRVNQTIYFWSDGGFNFCQFFATIKNVLNFHYLTMIEKSK